MALLRIVGVLALPALAGFCFFGFLATYEPPGSRTLRIAYAVVGVACVAGAGVVASGGRWRGGRPR